MNSFKFHPVGQGLFYTGSLAHKTYNFVYDCGTENKQQYLNSSIDSYIKDIHNGNTKNAEIDFVVISHLHRDHFSGLLNLARKTNIHKVYLPYLGYDKNFIALILAHIIFDNWNDEENNENMYPVFAFMSGLYGIEDSNDFPQIQAVFIEERNSEQFRDGDFCYSACEDYAHIGLEKYWKFVFINRAIDKSKIKLLNQKVSDILNCYGIKSIVELVSSKDGIQQISKIYHEVFAHEIRKNTNFLNMTSIVLIHYPLYKFPNAFYADSNEVVKWTSRRVESRYFSHWYPCDYTCFEFEKLWNPLTILSGDVMIDYIIEKLILSQLKQFEDKKQPLCGVLQIPHHGSKKNWIAWRHTSINSQVYVIPFGLGNRHRHPHPDTIENLISTKQSIQFVNQIQNFEYYID